MKNYKVFVVLFVCLLTGVFVNRKTDHFNNEKPTTSAKLRLKFTTKNHPLSH